MILSDLVDHYPIVYISGRDEMYKSVGVVIGEEPIIATDWEGRIGRVVLDVRKGPFPYRVLSFRFKVAEIGSSGHFVGKILDGRGGGLGYCCLACCGARFAFFGGMGVPSGVSSGCLPYAYAISKQQ